MNRDFALSLLRRMVEIPSLSGEESRLAGYLTEVMTEQGYRVHVDGAGNVIGDLEAGAGQSGPLIMLIGHMDTVPGDVPIRLEGNELYGRGAVDAKGPLATFICAARRARDAGLVGRLTVVGAVEEETPGSRGAKYLLDHFQPDAVIIGEPSGWSNVVLGYKGKIGVTYRVSCPPRHDAADGSVASQLAVGFWNRVEHHLADTGGERSAFRRPTATLRLIEADPERARLEISCRTPPGFEPDVFLSFIQAIRDDGEVEITETTPAIEVGRTDPTVRALLGAIRRQGVKPGLRVKTGTSDMNTVSVRWRVPMSAYGPGDSALDHTPDEHINLDEYLRAIDVLADALPVLARDLAQTQPPHEAAGPPADAAEAYSPEEEEEITKRLQALGYLE